MTEPAPNALARCMGGSACHHAPGTCTATVNLMDVRCQYVESVVQHEEYRVEIERLVGTVDDLKPVWCNAGRSPMRDLKEAEELYASALANTQLHRFTTGRVRLIRRTQIEATETMRAGRCDQ